MNGFYPGYWEGCCSLKPRPELPTLCDRWFDQSYQTGRSRGGNCSQSPLEPEKEFVIQTCNEIRTAWDGGKGGTILSDLRSNNSQTWVFASLLSGLDASVWSDAKLEVKGTGSFINPLFSSWLFDSLGKNFCWGCLFTIGLVLVRSGLGRSCRAGAGLWKKSFSFLIKSCLI